MIKWTVLHKIKILSLITYPHAIPNFRLSLRLSFIFRTQTQQQLTP